MRSHGARVSDICVDGQSINDSDNWVSPDRHHAIIETNKRILLIAALGINYSDIWIEIISFALKVYRKGPHCYCLPNGPMESSISYPVPYITRWSFKARLKSCVAFCAISLKGYQFLPINQIICHIFTKGEWCSANNDSMGNKIVAFYKL